MSSIASQTRSSHYIGTQDFNHHMIQLSNDGCSWIRENARNDRSRISKDDEINRIYLANPISIDFIDSPVIQLAESHSVSFALTQSQRVYVMGRDTQRTGILGLGENIYEAKEYTLIETLASKRIKQISLGVSHVAVLDDSGSVYIWGSGSNGQLAKLNSSTDSIADTSSAIPCLVQSSDLSNVKEVLCSATTTTILTISGQLFVLGQFSRHHKQKSSAADSLWNSESSAPLQAAQKQKNQVLYSWQNFAKIIATESSWGGCALTKKGDIVFFNRYFKSEKLSGQSNLLDAFVAKDRIFALSEEGLLEWDLGFILKNGFFTSSKQQQSQLDRQFDVKNYPPKQYLFTSQVIASSLVPSTDRTSAALSIKTLPNGEIFTEKSSLASLGLGSITTNLRGSISPDSLSLFSSNKFSQGFSAANTLSNQRSFLQQNSNMRQSSNLDGFSKISLRNNTSGNGLSDDQGFSSKYYHLNSDSTQKFYKNNNDLRKLNSIVGNTSLNNGSNSRNGWGSISRMNGSDSMSTFKSPSALLSPTNRLNETLHKTSSQAEIGSTFESKWKNLRSSHGPEPATSPQQGKDLSYFINLIQQGKQPNNQNQKNSGFQIQNQKSLNSQSNLSSSFLQSAGGLYNNLNTRGSETLIRQDAFSSIRSPSSKQPYFQNESNGQFLSSYKQLIRENEKLSLDRSSISTVNGGRSSQVTNSLYAANRKPPSNLYDAHNTSSSSSLSKLQFLDSANFRLQLQGGTAHNRQGGSSITPRHLNGSSYQGNFLSDSMQMTNGFKSRTPREVSGIDKGWSNLNKSIESSHSKQNFSRSHSHNIKSPFTTRSQQAAKSPSPNQSFYSDVQQSSHKVSPSRRHSYIEGIVDPKQRSEDYFDPLKKIDPSKIQSASPRSSNLYQYQRHGNSPRFHNREGILHKSFDDPNMSTTSNNLFKSRRGSFGAETDENSPSNDRQIKDNQKSHLDQENLLKKLMVSVANQTLQDEENTGTNCEIQTCPDPAVDMANQRIEELQNKLDETLNENKMLKEIITQSEQQMALQKSKHRRGGSKGIQTDEHSSTPGGANDPMNERKQSNHTNRELSDGSIIDLSCSDFLEDEEQNPNQLSQEENVKRSRREARRVNRLGQANDASHGDSKEGSIKSNDSPTRVLKGGLILEKVKLSNGQQVSAVVGMKEEQNKQIEEISKQESNVNEIFGNKLTSSQEEELDQNNERNQNLGPQRQRQNRKQKKQVISYTSEGQLITIEQSDSDQEFDEEEDQFNEIGGEMIGLKSNLQKQKQQKQGQNNLQERTTDEDQGEEFEYTGDQKQDQRQDKVVRSKKERTTSSNNDQDGNQDNLEDYGSGNEGSIKNSSDYQNHLNQSNEPAENDNRIKSPSLTLNNNNHQNIDGIDQAIAIPNTNGCLDSSPATKDSQHQHSKIKDNSSLKTDQTTQQMTAECIRIDTENASKELTNEQNKDYYQEGTHSTFEADQDLEFNFAALKKTENELQKVFQSEDNGDFNEELERELKLKLEEDGGESAYSSRQPPLTQEEMNQLAQLGSSPHSPTQFSPKQQFNEYLSSQSIKEDDDQEYIKQSKHKDGKGENFGGASPFLKNTLQNQFLSSSQTFNNSSHGLPPSQFNSIRSQNLRHSLPPPNMKQQQKSGSQNLNGINPNSSLNMSGSSNSPYNKRSASNTPKKSSTLRYSDICNGFNNQMKKSHFVEKTKAFERATGQKLSQYSDPNVSQSRLRDSSVMSHNNRSRNSSKPHQTSSFQNSPRTSVLPHDINKSPLTKSTEFTQMTMPHYSEFEALSPKIAQISETIQPMSSRSNNSLRKTVHQDLQKPVFSPSQGQIESSPIDSKTSNYVSPSSKEVSLGLLKSAKEEIDHLEKQQQNLVSHKPTYSFGQAIPQNIANEVKNTQTNEKILTIQGFTIPELINSEQIEAHIKDYIPPKEGKFLNKPELTLQQGATQLPPSMFNLSPIQKIDSSQLGSSSIIQSQLHGLKLIEQANNNFPANQPEDILLPQGEFDIHQQGISNPQFYNESSVKSSEIKIEDYEQIEQQSQSHHQQFDNCQKQQDSIVNQIDHHEEANTFVSQIISSEEIIGDPSTNIEEKVKRNAKLIKQETGSHLEEKIPDVLIQGEILENKSEQQQIQQSKNEQDAVINLYNQEIINHGKRNEQILLEEYEALFKKSNQKGKTCIVLALKSEKFQNLRKSFAFQAIKIKSEISRVVQNTQKQTESLQIPNQEVQLSSFTSQQAAKAPTLLLIKILSRLVLRLKQISFDEIKFSQSSLRPTIELSSFPINQNELLYFNPLDHNQLNDIPNEKSSESNKIINQIPQGINSDSPQRLANIQSKQREEQNNLQPSINSSDQLIQKQSISKQKKSEQRNEMPLEQLLPNVFTPQPEEKIYKNNNNETEENQPSFRCLENSNQSAHFMRRTSSPSGKRGQYSLSGALETINKGSVAEEEDTSYRPKHQPTYADPKEFEPDTYAPKDQNHIPKTLSQDEIILFQELQQQHQHQSRQSISSNVVKGFRSSILSDQEFSNPLPAREFQNVQFEKYLSQFDSNLSQQTIQNVERPYYNVHYDTEDTPYNQRVDTQFSQIEHLPTPENMMKALNQSQQYAFLPGNMQPGHVHKEKYRDLKISPITDYADVRKSALNDKKLNGFSLNNPPAQHLPGYNQVIHAQKKFIANKFKNLHNQHVTGQQAITSPQNTLRLNSTLSSPQKQLQSSQSFQQLNLNNSNVYKHANRK